MEALLLYVRILSVESWRHFEGVSHCPRGRGSLSFTTLTWYNEQVADNSTATPLNATSSQIVGLKLIALWRANSTGAATRQFFRLCILAMGVVPSWFIRLFIMCCGTMRHPMNWLHWANLIPALTGSSITSLFSGFGYSGLT